MIETFANAAPVEALELHIPPPNALTSKEELDLYRAALARAPESLELRYRVADLLHLADRFEEMVDVLQVAPDDSCNFVKLAARKAA